MQPKLSIGFPVYNGEKYMREALDSILRQDFADFELNISDNGSTDRTPWICEEYARQDSRVKVYRSSQNLGATWNFNRVVELANGTFFKWAFYDDVCCPGLFRKCIEEFDRADSDVVLVYPQTEFMDAGGAVYVPTESPKWDRVATSAKYPHRRLARVIWLLAHGQAMFGVIRMAALKQTRPAGIVAMDWIKIAELSLLGRSIELPEPLIRVRVHEANSTQSNQTWRELVSWHDPDVAASGKSARNFNQAILMEYLRAVAHAPLSPTEKFLCRGVVCTVWPWRLLWTELLSASGPARLWVQRQTRLRCLSGAGSRK
jgi:glycosyltransferase involved in cell wall biosynthesis